MNAVLLLAVLFHCSQRATGYDACVRETLTCAASGGAYGGLIMPSEPKATEIVAGCVAKEKKPVKKEKP